MTDVSLAVVGLARNCALPLGFTLTRLLHLGTQLPLRMVVGEDGSRDNTRAMIIGHGFEVVDTTPTAPAPRLERMARAREKVRLAYLDGPHADVVMVLDLDEEFLSNMLPRDIIAAVERFLDSNHFAHSAWSSPYYDLLALETDDLSFTDLPSRIAAAKRRPWSYRRFMERAVYDMQESLAERPPTECVSAFNGVALYRHEDYARSSYLSPDGAWLCDHVMFNRTLASGGRRMAIDPLLRVEMGDRHTRKSATRFYRQAVRGALAR